MSFPSIPSDANIYGQRIPFLPLITAKRSTLVVVAFVLSANCQGASLPFPSVDGGQGVRLFVESEVNWTWPGGGQWSQSRLY